MINSRFPYPTLFFSIVAAAIGFRVGIGRSECLLLLKSSDTAYGSRPEFT